MENKKERWHGQGGVKKSLKAFIKYQIRSEKHNLKKDRADVERRQQNLESFENGEMSAEQYVSLL